VHGVPIPEQLLIFHKYYPLPYNARLTVQIFDGGFYAFLCIKGDSEHLSD
jgi:hypothetical protein